MAARTAEVELLFLERIGDHWQFATKPNRHFDQLLLDFSRVPSLFSFKEIYFTPASSKAKFGKCYELNEAGMWFLSHLFSNWSEMYAQATRKDLPHCWLCGKECNGECAHCDKPFCETCYTVHEHKYRQEERQQKEQPKRCASCGKANPFCCNAHLCEECVTNHSLGCKHATFAYTFHFTHDNADSWERLHYRYDPNKSNNSRWNPRSDGAEWSSNTSGGTTASYYSVSKEVQEAFKVLGLTYTATVVEIKKAFKAKALVTHPDTGGRTEDMVKLNKAKDIALQYAGKR